MTLSELGRYKHNVMLTILQSAEIKQLLMSVINEDYEEEDILLGNAELGLYGLIHPYLYIPDTNETTETFICVETAVTDVDNFTIKDLSLYIQIIVHRNKMKVEGQVGTRADLLAGLINEKLNGAKNYGLGRVQLQECVPSTPSNDYYCRTLTYTVSDFNLHGAVKRGL